MAKKLPWFSWYADKWLSDEALRSVSIAARGLWVDMLSLMHKCDRRGYLQLAGKPVTAEQLARMTGCSTDEVSRLLAELLHSGVASVTDDGIVYSRAMVRDENKRQLCSAAGKRGGNPKLLTLKGQSKGDAKGSDNGGLNPASYMCIGSSQNGVNTHQQGVGGLGGGETLKGQAANSEADTKLDLPNEPPAPRSAYPADNPELAAVARRVVKHYQQTVKPSHHEGGGIMAVIAQLQRGHSETVLKNASLGYAEWCLTNKPNPQHRQSVENFFNKNTCEQFLDFDPKAKEAEARRREEQALREREDRKPRGPTLSGGAMAKLLEEQDKQSGDSGDSTSPF